MLSTKEIEATFRSMGWSTEEAKIYLVLLEIGAQPASVVASKLNRNRITVFHAMKRMVKKGILSEFPKKHGTSFAALSPDDLAREFVSFRDEETRRLTQRAELMQDLLPSLYSKVRTQAFTPVVQVLQGDEALRQIYARSLEATRMYAYYRPWVAEEHPDLVKIDDWHTEERIQRKISVQVIVPTTHEGLAFARLEKELKEVMTVPEGEFPVRDVTIITEDRLLLFSAEDRMGVEIRSAFIAENQRAIFSLAWETAKQKSLK